jgi:hypothetical protein
MESYAFSAVTPDMLTQLFWLLFSDAVRLDRDVYTTPLYLAQLLIQLVNPQPSISAGCIRFMHFLGETLKKLGQSAPRS